MNVIKIIIMIFIILSINAYNFILAEDLNHELFNRLIVTKKTLSNVCFQCHGYKGFSVIGGNYNNYFKKPMNLVTFNCNQEEYFLRTTFKFNTQLRPLQM